MFEPTGHESVDRSSALDNLARRAGLGAVSPHLAVGVCILVVLAVAAGAWRYLAHRPAEEFSFETQAGMAAGAAAGADESSAAEEPADADEVSGSVWVHVAGAVVRPGLYELAAGARAGDALNVAGGPREDACIDAVNLARPLDDGEQIYVPSHEEVESGAVAGAVAAPDGALGVGAAGASGAGGDGLIDINRATESELTALPGIGPATAGKIVADREANGPFASPQDLMRVSGIGDKKFAALQELITVR